MCLSRDSRIHYEETGLLWQLAVEVITLYIPSGMFAVDVRVSFKQARNLLGTMLSHEPPERGTMDGVLGRAFFAGGASVTAAKMQVGTPICLHGFPDAFL